MIMKKNLTYCSILSVLMIMLSVTFASCQKDDEATGNAQAMVKVVNADGTIAANVEVKMYDEETYAKFKNNNRTEPILRLKTNDAGIVTVDLDYNLWFGTKKQRMLMFVVQRGYDDNCEIWSTGKTFDPGKKEKLEIKLTPLKYPHK